ncbi:exopolysaccharide biosynthesis protein [Paucibacter sp. APW11]|uniref:Exopolysaccharide biosynthesis protein n=1 Tax=Roseateles aquae TaxID=3077235 RepID=A0ABU3PC65_9BURK|nr:exopolysaccharide biosynthesis protein [Paucibacter sp. APW11]MDT8999743.1 exopolysaccharide biosynthesis protein [Paucibacter sp. APW11]
MTHQTAGDRPLHEVLRDAASSLRQEHISVQELAAVHGHAAEGALLILLAVPCVLPVAGVGTVLGMGLLALAWSMWRGSGTAQLHPRVAALRLPRLWAQRVLRLLAVIYEQAARLARPGRRAQFSVLGQRLMAATVLLMAVLIVLPLPLGNVLPGLAICCFGLSLVLREAWLALAGVGMTMLSLGYCAALVWLAQQLGEWLPIGL